MTILVLTNNIGGLYSFRKEVMQAFIDNGYQHLMMATNVFRGLRI